VTERLTNTPAVG